MRSANHVTGEIFHVCNILQKEKQSFVLQYLKQKIKNASKWNNF